MTQDEIIEMASKSGLIATPWVIAFAKLVAAKEREACAKVCEKLGYTKHGGWTCAEEIRARGEA